MAGFNKIEHFDGFDVARDVGCDDGGDVGCKDGCDVG